MSPLLSEKDRSAKRLLQTLKQSLSVDALKSLLTKRQGNAGRERYRRAGLTASASFISKALTIVISFVSVPLTVNYLGAERYGVRLTVGSLLTWMWWGVGGVALAMALSKFCTSSPTQLFKIRGILRANRAPALVVEEPSLA